MATCHRLTSALERIVRETLSHALVITRRSRAAAANAVLRACADRAAVRPLTKPPCFVAHRQERCRQPAFSVRGLLRLLEKTIQPKPRVPACPFAPAGRQFEEPPNTIARRLRRRGRPACVRPQLRPSRVAKALYEPVSFRKQGEAVRIFAPSRRCASRSPADELNATGMKNQFVEIFICIARLNLSVRASVRHLERQSQLVFPRQERSTDLSTATVSDHCALKTPGRFPLGIETIGLRPAVCDRTAVYSPIDGCLAGDRISSSF